MANSCEAKAESRSVAVMARKLALPLTESVGVAIEELVCKVVAVILNLFLGSRMSFLRWIFHGDSESRVQGFKRKLHATGEDQKDSRRRSRLRFGFTEFHDATFHGSFHEHL